MMHPVARHCLGQRGADEIPEKIKLKFKLGPQLQVPDGTQIPGSIRLTSNSGGPFGTVRINTPHVSFEVKSRYLIATIPTAGDLKDLVEHGLRIRSDSKLMNITLDFSIPKYDILPNSSYGGLTPVNDPDSIIRFKPINSYLNRGAIDSKYKILIGYYLSSTNDYICELRDIYKLSSVEFTTL